MSKRVRGVINPVKEIGKIAKENDVFFILDSISGAIVEELNMDEFNVDAVVSASQKGFSCPPRISNSNCKQRSTQ